MRNTETRCGFPKWRILFQRSESIEAFFFNLHIHRKKLLMFVEKELSVDAKAEMRVEYQEIN